MARNAAGSYANNSRTIYFYIIGAVAVFYFILAFIFNFFPFGKSAGNAVEENIDAAAAAVSNPQAAFAEQISVAEQSRSAVSGIAPTIGDAVADANSQASILIRQAEQALAAAQIIKARDLLNNALKEPMTAGQLSFVKGKLSELADQWLFSNRVLDGDNLCSFYKVKSGDLFAEIGELYKVPWQIIMQVNNIKDERGLRIDQKLKVINGPFHVRVNRSTFTLDLYLQDTFVRSFKVGIGKPGHETPTGLWLVTVGGKMVSPPWTDPDTGKRYEAEDPNYPLGDRWIAIEGIEGKCLGRTGFAIHGTKDEKEIGAAVSRGCIRLENKNVVLVYDLMMPGFSQVLVTD